MNMKLLEKKIKESGLKKGYIADKLGVSPQTFSSRLRGEIGWTVKEIAITCRLLNLSARDRDQIFFSKDVV